MSTGFWWPFYSSILHAAMLDGVTKNACADQHRFCLQTYDRSLSLPHEDIDAFTYTVLSKPNGKLDLLMDNRIVDNWSHGMWDEAVHTALLHYCWHLTLDQTRQSLCRLEIKGMIRRTPPITAGLRYNPMHYDDCEPWPRWLVVNPLTALAGV
jgi:hypothetical protein